MPSKSSKRPWRPAGLKEIEQADIRELFSHEYRSQIIDAVHPVYPLVAEALIIRGLDIVELYRGFEHNQSRPRIPELRRTLRRLENQTKKFLVTLSTLDDDARRYLEIAADSDQREFEDDIPRHVAEVSLEGKTYGGLGDLRINNTIDRLDTLLAWDREAQKTLPEAPRGRPREDARRWAVEQLRDLWQEVTGAQPTLSVDWDTHRANNPFLRYVTVRHQNIRDC